MAAYYPLFEEEIKQGPPGIPGIGFKLTNDGNYDMESKLLKNVLNPEEDNDSSTKKYVDDLRKRCLIRNSSYFDAKRKFIRNVEDPIEESDATTKKYVDELRGNSLIHDEDRFDAKNKFISNVKWPEKDLDAVNKQCLVYSCILWDKDKRIYYAHDQRISNVKAPQVDSDCANKYYVDGRTEINDKIEHNILKRDDDGLYVLSVMDFFATVKTPFECSANVFKEVKFDKISSRLLDKDLKVSTDMHIKFTVEVLPVESGRLQFMRLQVKLNDHAVLETELAPLQPMSHFLKVKKDDVFKVFLSAKSNIKLHPYLYVRKIAYIK
ncbi:hypothetical protein AVEN_114202-1 [Araneus ventricosus]|uniref:Uncharacterized protein n=1 Tax=Araneus ventricosus TaxID=182803 RepID=A0A4Y2CF12_ARAVE|nr:hypothetical protein AVEN_114202-1 [Araneus ventricosus]